MSYYYDVAIGMSLTSFRELWEYEKEFVDKEGSLLDHMSDFIVRKDGTVILYWSEIQWNRHPFGKRIERFLFNLNKEGKRAYTFIKMGEDLEDVTEYYYCGEDEIDYIEGFGIRRELFIDTYDGDERWAEPDRSKLENL